MTGQVKRYTALQLQMIAHEERIVWLGFPSSFRFLYEHWTRGWVRGRPPRLSGLVAYSVAGPDAPSAEPLGAVLRRAWTSTPRSRAHLVKGPPAGSVDPSSIVAGQPSRLAEGAEE